MRYLLLLLLLTSCSVAPSEQISDSVKTDLKGITQQLDNLSINLPKECQNALKSNLKPIYTQISGLSDRVESINLSCKEEKEVLKQKITVRDSFIVILGIFVVGLIYLRIKRL